LKKQIAKNYTKGLQVYGNRIAMNNYTNTKKSCRLLHLRLNYHRGNELSLVLSGSVGKKVTIKMMHGKKRNSCGMNAHLGIRGDDKR
jgi:hypothetical protein